MRYALAGAENVGKLGLRQATMLACIPSSPIGPGTFQSCWSLRHDNSYMR